MFTVKFFDVITGSEAVSHAAAPVRKKQSQRAASGLVGRLFKRR